MAFVHGKNTVMLVAGNDLSVFTNTSTFTRTSDKHDVTTYGKNSHVYQGGLGDGTASMGGVYDNTAAGPRRVIEPLIGTTVTLVRRPEGTGVGKPQDSVNAIITSYVETSPVADMVSWSCDYQLSDDVTTINQ